MVSPSIKRIMMAEIVGVHGIKGEVKLISHASSPDILVKLGPLSDEKGVRQFEITSLHPHKTHYITRLKGIDDRTQAEKLRGTKLYIERSKFPELDDGEYYQADLIGFDVLDKSGTRLGAVVSFENFGAGELLQIRDDDGKTSFLPFCAPVLVDVVPDNGQIIVDPPGEDE